MSESKRIVGPITTEFGTFQPGDKAIAITMCTSRLNVARVEYVGYVERYGKKFAQVRRPTRTFNVLWADTGEKARWPYGDRKVKYEYVEGTTISTLQENRLIPDSASTDQLIQAI